MEKRNHEGHHRQIAVYDENRKIEIWITCERSVVSVCVSYWHCLPTLSLLRGCVWVWGMGASGGNEYREFIKLLAPVLVDDPLQKDVAKYLTAINSDDAPILASAVNSGADFLITWDRKHFIGKNIHIYSSLKIVTPGEFLKHFRKYVE